MLPNRAFLWFCAVKSIREDGTELVLTGHALIMVKMEKNEKSQKLKEFKFF